MIHSSKIVIFEQERTKSSRFFLCRFPFYLVYYPSFTMFSLFLADSAKITPQNIAILCINFH